MDAADASASLPAGVFEFEDPEIAAHPQQFHPMLRADMPAFRSPIGVIVSRHEDVQATLRDHVAFSSDQTAVDIGQVRPLIPLQLDPPEHVKFRRLLDPLFAPRRVNAMETEVRGLVTDLLDEFADTGSCEANAQFAVPLPCTVFLRLLGLPLEDLDTFLRFKNDIIRPPVHDLEAGARIRRATSQEIYAYFEDVIAQRRAEPRDDLVSGFIAAEVDGVRLSTEDILDICYLFLLAGLDTVTASLGCSLAYLAHHRDHQQALRDDPALVPGAVEELLRWETPVPGVMRVATDDIVVAGTAIAKGEGVTCLLASANTDESEFPEPERVDFARPANRHLAFGAGVHRCLGSHLARLEMRVALEEWHRRIPEYAVAPGEVPRYGAGIRSVEYLPLVWDAGS